MRNMVQYIKRTLSIMLSILLISVIFGCNDSKQSIPKSKYAELGIYVFGTTSWDDSDRGHTYLTLTNTSDDTIDFLNYPIESGKEITLGYWPDSKLKINYDALKDLRNQDKSHDVVSIKKFLTEDEVQKLINFTVKYSGTKYKALTNNCTTYALGAWNMVNNEKEIKESKVDAPKWTKDYIEKNFDEKDVTKGVYKPCDILDDFDLFYVKSDGTLVPEYIALSDVDATLDMENTPNNIDISWNKKAKVMFDKQIMINKVRVSYQKKDSDQYDYVDTYINADKGGCILSNLESNTTYVIKLCPIYEYTFENETKQVKGEWISREVKIDSLSFFGSVVNLNGDICYWKYNDNTFSKSGDSGYFGVQKETVNQMVRRNTSGNETVLFQAEGYGSFAIVNKRVFYSSSDGNVCICDIDGKNKVIIGKNKILDATEDGKYLICSDEKRISAIDTKTEKEIVLSEYGSYIDCHDGIVYYQPLSSDFYEMYNGKITISCIKPDGTNQKDLFTTTSELYNYNAGETQVGQMYFGNEYIYFSYGCVSGSAFVFQGGKIIRMKYDGSDNEVVAGEPNLVEAEFSINKDGSVNAFDLNSRLVMYVNMKDFCVENDNVYSIDRSNGEKKEIISVNEYSIIGDEPPKPNDDSNIYNIDFIQKFDDKVYYLVKYGKKDTSYSIGWRTGYVRAKVAFMQKDLTSGKVEIIYQF